MTLHLFCSFTFSSRYSYIFHKPFFFEAKVALDYLGIMYKDDVSLFLFVCLKIQVQGKKFLYITRYFNQFIHINDTYLLTKLMVEYK